jgi:hypothetical protein
MALHDLTPQLRTRLSRLERLVGLFVAFAVILLLVGLTYYTYVVAERKGWFVRKLPYFTFVQNAHGLKPGDPIRLMGFDIGEITEITAQPPFDYYDVYVAFVVKEQFVGYLWDDSRAVVASTDLLQKRSVEVTKGTNGPPTYLFHPIHSVSIDEAESLRSSTNLSLAQNVYDATGKRVLAAAFKPASALKPEHVTEARGLGVKSLAVFDRTVKTKGPVGVWDYQSGLYRAYQGKTDKGFFLPPKEAPALAARLEHLADTVEQALPNVLGLTNRINLVLDQATSTARQAEDALREVQPVLRHFGRIGANLTNSQGSLGQWLIPPELRVQLTQTLASANSLLVHSDQNVAGLSSNLTTVLLQAASLTSNLNAQVVANSNILAEISTAVTNADHLMQGLKRHWLLRSAFKGTRDKSESPTRSGRGGRAVSPKYSEPRR